MFDSIKDNKIRTLEPKKQFIVNDINISECNLTSLFTIIAVSTLFLLSMRFVVLGGI